MSIKSSVIRRTDYTISIKPACKDEAWDRAVAESPGGHYEQTSPWAAVKSLYGWSPVQLSLTWHDQLIGGALILLRRIGPLSIGFISRGPFCLQGSGSWMEKIVEEIELFAGDHRLAYLVVLPHYEGDQFHKLFINRGYIEKPAILPPRSLVTYTTLIDLHDDLDVIMSRMNAKTRYNVRRGLSDGVVVRLGSSADVEPFRKMMWQLCARRNVSPKPPQKDYFANLWQAFSHTDYLKLFITCCEDKPVSSAMAFAFGNTVSSWKWGWSGEYAKHMPNHVMHWEVIKWAKENGFRYYDFVQIIPEHGRELMQKQQIDGPYAGVTKFKMGYGGGLVALPTALSRSYLPGMNSFFRWGGARLPAETRN